MSHSEETPDTSHIQNPEVSHERSDVSVRGILIFGVGLIISAVVIHLLLWWLMIFFEHREIAKEPKASPMAGGRQRLPPEPRLQLAPGHEVHPDIEMKKLLDKEREVLGSYGWIDPASGVVRVPIERAKDLIAQRGIREGGRQKAEGGREKAEGGRQKAEGGRQKAEGKKF
ncbi:MAG TPA: hypothetical protein VGK99_00545 [Acidobacteriota bacterium]|jgi:hypothetical protein